MLPGEFRKPGSSQQCWTCKCHKDFKAKQDTHVGYIDFRIHVQNCSNGSSTNSSDTPKLKTLRPKLLQNLKNPHSSPDRSSKQLPVLMLLHLALDRQARSPIGGCAG